MTALPSLESILLQVHQSLRCAPFQTKPKRGFATGQMQLTHHKKMAEEILDAIFDALDMDPRAREDALRNLMEFGGAYQFLRLNCWTFAADQRQVLWQLLAHFFVPCMARRAAFWNLDETLDHGMPGGRFWYLPEPRKVDDKQSLYLPVAQVVDWLLDLLGMPLEEFADKRSQSLEDSNDKSSETLMRSLYNWRKETTPNPDSFREYFPDSLNIKFRGTFQPEDTQSLAEQFAAALAFVEHKKLTAELLRLEIPMTEDGRLEAILDGSCNDDEKALFIAQLAERYSAPSSKTIRQRLLFARLVQDGYYRLLKAICPGVERRSADSNQNKLLQLFTIYKLVYNLTIDAWRNCKDQGEVAENVWFEEHLPEWDKQGIYLSILPSQRETANSALAELLTRKFAEMQPSTELEDYIGMNNESAAKIIQLRIEQLCAIGDEFKAELALAERLKTASPWRTLQEENRYRVVSEIAQRTDLGPKVRHASIQRMRELASTPSETLQTVLLELDGFLNNQRSNRPKNTQALVQALLQEAESSPAFGLWEAPILQYKAKHLLACNDFERASKLFKEALEAGHERSYGPLRGEVARDCLAVAVANQKLIANNHEKFYREMLDGGMMSDCEELPSIEETARWASTYFWDTLYKPYPGIPAMRPRTIDASRKILDGLMPLFLTGDRGSFLAWIKANRQLLKSSLPDVEGNSVLMLLIKMRSSFVQGIPSHLRTLLNSRAQNLETMLANWKQFLGLLAQEAPKQLNITDLKGQTPLMLMAESGETTLVQIMLNAGADPDCQDWQGMTALHSAIKSRVASCVDALLDHPCSLDKVTFDGQSPLHTASWIANRHACQRLLQMAPVLAWKRNSRGLTPLEQVEFLIGNPQSLTALSSELKKNGRICASKKELRNILDVLEQAPPAAMVRASEE